MSENRTAIVTGGARGIGKAIVRELVSSGINVSFTYRSNKKLAGGLLAELRDKTKTCIIAIQADVRDSDKAKEVVKKTKETFGRIDMLINNAGITKDKSFLMMTKEEWQEVIDTDLNGTFNYCKAVIFDFLKQRSGKIVNIASVSGIMGTAGQTNYSAAKAGIIGFTKSLAKEVGRYGITVNAVAPGYVDTQMLRNIPDKIKNQLLDIIPLKRWAKPEEVAKLVTFLISENADYITGKVISIDGGMI